MSVLIFKRSKQSFSRYDTIYYLCLHVLYNVEIVANCWGVWKNICAEMSMCCGWMIPSWWTLFRCSCIFKEAVLFWLWLERQQFWNASNYPFFHEKLTGKSGTLFTSRPLRLNSQRKRFHYTYAKYNNIILYQGT